MPFNLRINHAMYARAANLLSRRGLGRQGCPRAGRHTGRSSGVGAIGPLVGAIVPTAERRMRCTRARVYAPYRIIARTYDAPQDIALDAPLHPVHN